MKYAMPAFALMIAACSGQSSNRAADAQADQLDKAAEQSTAPAARVLHNEADAIRENGATGLPGAPNSSVQQAMDKAGQAQRDDARQAPVPGTAPVPKRARPDGTSTAAPDRPY